MKVITPPSKFFYEEEYIIFLAGSIEMGTAINWQAKFCRSFKHYEGIILNPRRFDWDSSWKQNMNNAQFREQVEWELHGLEVANLIALNFDPKTQSPITLLELGLYAESKKIRVCCPEGYYRKGNVDIVCNKYRIPICDNWEQFISGIMLDLPGYVRP